MISQRLVHLLDIFTRLGQNWGSTTLQLDPSTFNFSNSTNAKLRNRFKRNYYCSVFWAIASIISLVKSYHYSQLQSFYVLSLLLIGGLGAFVCYSILFWYSDDLMEACRMTLHFCKHFQGDMRFSVNFQKKFT